MQQSRAVGESDGGNCDTAIIFAPGNYQKLAIEELPLLCFLAVFLSSIGMVFQPYKR